MFELLTYNKTHGAPFLSPVYLNPNGVRNVFIEMIRRNTEPEKHNIIVVGNALHVLECGKHTASVIAYCMN